MVALLGAVYLVRFAWIKQYSIDELDYAHAAWLVARGLVPYRDFFDHHFPLLYQALAPLFVLVPEDPEGIRLLRLALVPVGLAVGWAVWTINRRWAGDPAALGGALAIFGVATFTGFVTEIRPDGLALALFLVSLAVVERGWLPDRWRGLVAGVLLGLAVWSSQKVLLYGLPLALLFARDLVSAVRGRGQQSLGSALAYLTGILVAVGAAALYLLSTESAEAFYRWCVEWPALHESTGRRFGWTGSVASTARIHGWLFLMAALGAGASVSRAWTRPEKRWLELVLVLLAGSTLLSYAVQSAPYPYSLLPFLAFVGLFAGRGLAVAGRFVGRLGRVSARITVGTAAVCLALWGAVALLELEGRLDPTNAYQHEVLERIGELTAADDHVYANSGSFVTRPPVHFFVYTNAFIRQSQSGLLEREIPEAILERRAVAFFRDIRFASLPDALRRFLLTHYAPYDANLWLWGRGFERALGADWDETFFAIVDGRYFVHPPEASSQGELTVDGVAVGAAPFRLTRGEHRVRYRGRARDLAILWLPRNGERYEPRMGSVHRFSVLFGGVGEERASRPERGPR